MSAIPGKTQEKLAAQTTLTQRGLTQKHAPRQQMPSGQSSASVHQQAPSKKSITQQSTREVKGSHEGANLLSHQYPQVWAEPPISLQRPKNLLKVDSLGFGFVVNPSDPAATTSKSDGMTSLKPRLSDLFGSKLARQNTATMSKELFERLPEGEKQLLKEKGKVPSSYLILGNTSPITNPLSQVSTPAPAQKAAGEAISTTGNQTEGQDEGSDSVLSSPPTREREDSFERLVDSVLKKRSEQYGGEIDPEDQDDIRELVKAQLIAAGIKNPEKRTPLGGLSTHSPDSGSTNSSGPNSNASSLAGEVCDNSPQREGEPDSPEASIETTSGSQSQPGAFKVDTASVDSSSQPGNGVSFQPLPPAAKQPDPKSDDFDLNLDLDLTFDAEDTKSQEIDSLNLRKSQNKRHLTKVESDIKLIKDEIGSLQPAVNLAKQSLDSAIHVLVEKLADFEQCLKKEREKISKNRIAHPTKPSEMGVMKFQTNNDVKGQAEIEQAKQDLEQIKQKLNTIESRHKQLLTQLEEAQKKLNNLNSKRCELLEAIRELDERLRILQPELTETEPGLSRTSAVPGESEGQPGLYFNYHPTHAPILIVRAEGSPAPSHHKANASLM